MQPEHGLRTAEVPEIMPTCIVDSPQSLMLHDVASCSALTCVQVSSFS